jgi:hypothetical protein
MSGPCCPFASASGHNAACTNQAQAHSCVRLGGTVVEVPARHAQKAEQIRTSPHRLKGVGLSR